MPIETETSTRADGSTSHDTRDAEGSRTAPPDPGRAMRTCPVCGHDLDERKCKLFCPRPGCGYFLSCADFY